MPRYYFNLRNDISIDDPQGKELPDVEAARAVAIKYARAEAAVGIVKKGKLNLKDRIEVTSESGQDVLTVTYGDVIEIQS